MTELTVSLPDDLAEKAKAAGLLNAAGIERALRAALRREAAQKFLEIGRALRSDGTPPMTEDEIQSEIDADRAERRANAWSWKCSKPSSPRATAKATPAGESQPWPPSHRA